MASTTVRKVGVKLIRLSRAVTRIRTSAQAEGLRRTSQSNVLKISARLNEAKPGSVTNWPALDSFLRDRSREAPQTQEVRELVVRHRGGTLALVTHQVNITALTGFFPAEGEVLILTPGGDGFTVAGRLRASDVGAN